jgi:hypothetical protein
VDRGTPAVQFAEQISAIQLISFGPIRAWCRICDPAVLERRSSTTGGARETKKIRQAFQAAIDNSSHARGLGQRFWRLSAAIMQGTPDVHESGKEFYNQNNRKGPSTAPEAGYRGEPVRWMTTTEFPHQRRPPRWSSRCWSAPGSPWTCGTWTGRRW